MPSQLPEGVTRKDMFTVDVDLIEVDPEHNYTDSDRGDITAFAESIAASGVHNPVRCYRNPEGKYVLLAGFRRMAAVKLLNSSRKQKIVEKIPVIVEDRYANEADRAVSQMLENAHRVDASPMDKARAYRHMIDVLGLDEGEIARRLGEKRENITRLLMLLAASQPVRKAVEDGRISATAAAQIVKKHKDDPEAQRKALETAITASGSKGKATVRGTTKATRSRKPRLRTRTVKEIYTAIELLQTVTSGKDVGNDKTMLKLDCAAATLLWVVGDDQSPWDGVEMPKPADAKKDAKDSKNPKDEDPRQTRIV